MFNKLAVFPRFDGTVMH